MSKKNSITTCSPLEWKDMLYCVQQLRREGDYRMALLIYTGAHTGLRISDLLKLSWYQLLNQESFTIIEKKTKKSRTITINSSLQELIQFYFNQVKPEIHEFIFKNRRGNPFTVQFVNVQLHEIYDRYKIKIKGGSSHSLRKCFAKRVYEIHHKTEAALILLSQILNHATTQVTRRYIGIESENIANAYVNL